MEILHKMFLGQEYLDDVLVPRKIVEENLDIVQEVVRRLDEHGLTLKLKNCFFFKKRSSIWDI